MVIAVAVALAREVNPFGVAELVAHEVKITFTGQAEREQADHFVQRDAAVDDQALAGVVHVPVHLLVHQLKRDGFVADERLVVAFGIADVSLAVTPVEQRGKKFPQLPLVV